VSDAELSEALATLAKMHRVNLAMSTLGRRDLYDQGSALIREARKALREAARR
jgi:hypothetical protein